MIRGKHATAPARARFRRVALVVAPFVTLASVGIGVAGVDPGDGEIDFTRYAAADIQVGDRTVPVSRDASRMVTEERVLNTAPTDRVVAKRWTTADLDLRAEPAADAKVHGEVAAYKKIRITGRTFGDYAEVVVKGDVRWVTAAYLVGKKPAALRGLSYAPCPDGSAIERALQSQAVRVYRAVCAAFPELSRYGGQDGHGEHVNGQAIDFMVPSHAVGERVKDFLYRHHAQLDLFDIIWAQHIWTIQRSGEGFRHMSNRGSATANHYDHVHIRIR